MPNIKITAIVILLLAVISLALFSDRSATSTQNENTNAPVSGLAVSSTINSKSLVGSWRAYPQNLYYDVGGSIRVPTPSSRKLELKANGKWAFGSSSGTWKVADITTADWEKWGVQPYGPTKKIVLNNWNKKGADGPIEESPTVKGRVDFIWVIYKVEPPVVRSAGMMHAKFGH